MGASLDYGFATAFTEQSAPSWRCCTYFQGFVDVDVLRPMGDTSDDWHVPAVAGLTREQAIALLDRAAEVGLLTALGGGYYRIHPALPWFFWRLYEEHYPCIPQCYCAPSRPRRGRGAAGGATRAYVEAIGALGDYYHNQYTNGNRDVIGALRSRRPTCCTRGVWPSARLVRRGQRHAGPARPLRPHRAAGRVAALVAEIVPAFVDP